MKIEETATQIELANNVFEYIYEQEDLIEEFTIKIQKKLNRWSKTKDIDDYNDCYHLLVSELYNRLSRAQLSTLQKYSNDDKLIEKLLSGVVVTICDNEKNNGKIYEMVQEEVIDDKDISKIKRVRDYKQQISLDYEETDSEGSSFKLGDIINIDDIHVPEIRNYWKKQSVQVLKNIDLFSAPQRDFISLLFTQGEEKTKELLGMSTSTFNQKVKRIEKWISKHEAFKDIPTYDEQLKIDSLTQMAHFRNMIDLAERTQVQSLLKQYVENNTPWVMYLLNNVVDNANDCVSNWDQAPRKNSYQFIKGMIKLEQQYRKEVLE